MKKVSVEEYFQGKLLQAFVPEESQIFARMADLGTTHPPLACAVPAPAEHMPWKSNCTVTACTQKENKPICRIYETTCRSERHERFQT